MQTILFAIPLKPGTLGGYKEFVKELTGARKDDYSDLLNRYGLKNARVWCHQFAGRDYAMIVHDAEDDAMERLRGWTSSTHPFDRWFDQQVSNYFDVENFDSLPEQPHFLYDFRPQRA